MIAFAATVAVLWSLRVVTLWGTNSSSVVSRSTHRRPRPAFVQLDQQRTWWM